MCKQGDETGVRSGRRHLGELDHDKVVEGGQVGLVGGVLGGQGIVDVRQEDVARKVRRRVQRILPVLRLDLLPPLLLFTLIFYYLKLNN
jgi:hypothetical protein